VPEISGTAPGVRMLVTADAEKLMKRVWGDWRGIGDFREYG